GGHSRQRARASWRRRRRGSACRPRLDSARGESQTAGERRKRKSEAARMTRRRYVIETFGCQMNVHDSERMAGLLEQAGYERAETDGDADVVVINTCSVREHAEEKLYTRLGELRVLAEETGRSRVVAVAGCAAQQEGDALFKKTNGHLIDVVLGTHRLKQLPVLVERAAEARGGAGGEVDVA